MLHKKKGKEIKRPLKSRSNDRILCTVESADRSRQHRVLNTYQSIFPKGMIGMIVVIGNNPFCAEEQTIRGSIGAIGVCIGAIGAVCAFSLHTTMHMCRQTKSIMCMHICTNAQNVFADRAQQVKQGLSDRRTSKGGFTSRNQSPFSHSWPVRRPSHRA
jgi:hypothetical protein